MSDEENKSSALPNSAKEEDHAPNGDTSDQEDKKKVKVAEGPSGDHLEDERPESSAEAEKKQDEEKIDADTETTDASSGTLSPKKGRKRKRQTESDSSAKQEDGPNGETPETGKRQRKKVQKLEITKFTEREKKPEMTQGSGEKLGDMPRVELALSKTHSEDLRPLHRILFNRIGQPSEIKKNIRKFNGFPWKKDSHEYDKKLLQLGRCKLAMLKQFCDVLDLEKKGTRDDVLTRVTDFLLKPEASGKALPKPKTKARRSSQGKKGKVTTPKGKKKDAKEKKKEEKDKKKKKPASPRKRPAKSKEEVEESEEEEDMDDESDAKESAEEGDKSEAESDTPQKSSDEPEEEDEAEEQEEEEEEEEEEKPPPKKRAKPEKVKTPKKANKTPKKKEKEKKEKEVKKVSPKKAATPKPKKKAAPVSSDDESSDDEPLITKKRPPSDEELRDVIKKILDSANLEEVTMKTVCREVFEKYPDFDLTSRKDFIKNTVKQIIR